MPLDPFVRLCVHFVEFLRSECLVELHALHYCDLFALADVQLECLVAVVLHEEVHVSTLKRASVDRVSYPLLIVNITLVKVIKVELRLRLWSDLKRTALVLLNAATTVRLNQLL